MAKRGVKNECHVDVASIGENHRSIRRIADQGLSYYLCNNPGYNKALVVDFYKNMRIPDAGTEHLPGA